MKRFTIVIIGGGASGFFAALSAKEANPQNKIIILEKTNQLLSKVKISGGGRCNVTHFCFDPKELIKNYPRGSKELLGPFHQFQPQDTLNWFKKRGVNLKTEADGRMFPDTDCSSTIIDCFLHEASSIDIQRNTKIQGIQKTESGFEIQIENKPLLFADRIILATGSGKIGWDIAQKFGHTVTPTAPSLFTLKIASFPLIDLAGLSVLAKLSLPKGKIEQKGPLLITHWGFSGPAALKLSAWGARFLAKENYRADLLIDWAPNLSLKEIEQTIFDTQSSNPSKKLINIPLFSLPKSLWRALLERFEISQEIPLNQIKKAKLLELCQKLKNDLYQINGKTTNKEEFVTCGGIKLSEVDFKTMESKVSKGLHFAGEVLDIDGVTGGFNFQNAWTTGYIAGRAASNEQHI